MSNIQDRSQKSWIICFCCISTIDNAFDPVKFDGSWNPRLHSARKYSLLRASVESGSLIIPFSRLCHNTQWRRKPWNNVWGIKFSIKVKKKAIKTRKALKRAYEEFALSNVRVTKWTNKLKKDQKEVDDTPAIGKPNKHRIDYGRKCIR